MSVVDVVPAPWVVGQETQYVVGLRGEVTEVGDGTITIGGITVPTRITPDGPARYLSLIWPADDQDEPDHSECVDDEDYQLVERQLDRALLGLEVLHNEHHDGVFRQCLHEVCRQMRGAL